MHARWPEQTVAVDEHMREQAEYIDDAIREFRLRYKAKLQPPKAKGKTAPAPVVPPTHACVYAAREYPSWQAEVLRQLQKMHQVNASSLFCFMFLSAVEQWSTAGECIDCCRARQGGSAEAGDEESDAFCSSTLRES